MSDIESKIRDAYNSASMPAHLKEHTLRHIDAYAQSQERNSDALAEVSLNTAPAQQKEIPGQAELQVMPGGVAAKRRRRSRSWVAALAACVAVLLVGFGGFRLYATETAYIGIDINPSLELGINRFDVVVSTQAFNDEAQEILDELSLEGMSLDKALEVLSENVAFSRYISEDSFVDISVTSGDQNQSQNLQATCQSYLDTLPCEGVCNGASFELRSEAQSHHMGTGRYQAALILLELDASLTLEDCKTMSMQELRSRIAAAGGEDELESLGTHHGQGQGHGQGARSGQGYGQGNR